MTPTKYSPMSKKWKSPLEKPLDRGQMDHLSPKKLGHKKKLLFGKSVLKCNASHVANLAQVSISLEYFMSLCTIYFHLIQVPHIFSLLSLTMLSHFHQWQTPGCFGLTKFQSSRNKLLKLPNRSHVL